MKLKEQLEMPKLGKKYQGVLETKKLLKDMQPSSLGLKLLKNRANQLFKLAYRSLMVTYS